MIITIIANIFFKPLECTRHWGSSRQGVLNELLQIAHLFSHRHRTGTQDSHFLFQCSKEKWIVEHSTLGPGKQNRTMYNQLG